MVEEDDKVITEKRQAELRGSLSGIDGIIRIQTAIRDGITSEESGIQMLINIYGYDENTAEQLITGYSTTTTPVDKPQIING